MFRMGFCILMVDGVFYLILICEKQSKVVSLGP